jgi:hypothetical protein
MTRKTNACFGHEPIFLNEKPLPSNCQFIIGIREEVIKDNLRRGKVESPFEGPSTKHSKSMEEVIFFVLSLGRRMR